MSPTLTFAATQAGMILGTAAYMSPEQAKGRPTDKRTDVWAFGCVLFEMLTARRAFEGEDVTDTEAARRCTSSQGISSITRPGRFVPSASTRAAWRCSASLFQSSNK